MSLFYDHLVDLSEFEAELGKFALKPNEKEKLLKLLDETIHHELFTHFLEILPLHAHVHFAGLVKERPHHPEVLVFVRQYRPEIDNEIGFIGNRTAQRFLDAIHESVVQ